MVPCLKTTDFTRLEGEKLTEKKVKINKIREVRDKITKEHVLEALEEERKKPYRRPPKTRDYFIIDQAGNLYDSKDIYARAASIATGKEYTCGDFYGGKISNSKKNRIK